MAVASIRSLAARMTTDSTKVQPGITTTAIGSQGMPVRSLLGDIAIGQIYSARLEQGMHSRPKGPTISRP